jgi:hypothetical protein
VIKGFTPAFTSNRVAGAVAGIDFVSQIATLSDPIVRDSGGAAAEVPKLITLVSQKTGLSTAQVEATLKAKFPHVFAFLQAIPLQGVEQELPQLVGLLTPKVAIVAPNLTGALLALPTVTDGWDAIPGIGKLTRLNGSPVRSVPQVVAYFQHDVIGRVIKDQRQHFESLRSPWPPVTVFSPLLLIVGLAVLAYGLTNLIIARRRSLSSTAVA